LIGEENALWDCGLILDAAKYGFPEDKGHAAIAQWAQEYREICQIIPLEIKTGQIHNNWLKNTAPYFLIYLTHLPDTIFALPRNRITGFESSRNAMRIPRRAIQNRAMLPHAEEALAPYAWPISGIHDFLKQLASGQDTIQNPINGVVVHQRLEGFPVTLSKILDAKIAQRVVCNQAIEQFMSYFENMDEIRFESPPAAPIGGDLVMYWCGIPITIQHKAGHSTHFVQKGYKPHLKYDFIVWDTLSGGEVVVYARGAPTFEEVVSKAFDKRTGRRKLGYAMLEFIKKHVVEAKRAWIRDIRDQKIVPESIVSRKLKKATEEAAEVWEDERAVEEGIVHEETVQEVMDIRQGDKKDKKGKTDEPPDDAGQRKLGREQQNALLLNLLGAKLNKSARNRMPPSPIRLRVLDKDQCHPFGSAVILRCTGDVNNIPESGEEAVDLISTDPEDYNRPCIHVRCAVQCPDYSVRLRLEDHEFPLDASKEYLPITNQAFVLFSSTPLETIEKGLPSRILCLPSERMQVSTQILHEQREINVPVAPSEQRPSHGFMRRSQFGIRKHSYRGPQLGYWMEIDQIIENFEAIFGAAERGQDASFMISQGISRSDNIGAKSYVMTLGKCLQGLVDYGVGIPGKVTRQ
jgi:hypothetical protein